MTVRHRRWTWPYAPSSSTSEWQGAASDSFRDLYEKWHRGARDVKEALDGISQMLAGAARTYQETEDQLAAQLRG